MSRFPTRIRGFVMLGNLALPVLIALGVAWGCVAFWSAVETELGPPVARLIEDAENLAVQARSAAENIERTADTVRTEAIRVQESATAIVAPLTSFSIDIPPFEVPYLNPLRCRLNLNAKEALNLTTCFPRVDVLAGIGRTINDGLKKSFAGPRAEFAKISDSIERARDGIDRLGPLADNFRAQAVQFQARAEGLIEARDRIGSKVGRIARIAGSAMAALGLWAVLVYLLWVQDRLATGWRMLRHGTPA